MMPGNIAVVYEKGVLRPLRPLHLPERTQLEIYIVPPHKTTGTEAEKVYQLLVQAGLTRPHSPIEVDEVTETERRQAADAYGQAGPLSELIIAERDHP
jgi:predicted DNA-binding antitoxin AbrB/MazE fold protein